MFCKCGKLMSKTDVGYECICGIKKDFFGNEINVNDEERIRGIKKKYRTSKYPNMSDELVRIAKPYEEDETTDETFSSLKPSELEKIRRKN